MKKLFSLAVFFLMISFSGRISAQQSFANQPVAVQRADDGVLVAYPNPARDFIYVKAKDAALQIKQVSFYTILGTEVATFGLNANASEINIDRLRPGKYLMKYSLSDGTQKVTQIIKQ